MCHAHCHVFVLQLVTAKLKKFRLRAKETEIDTRILEMEDIYHKIKECTGINDIHDILDNMSSQGDTTMNITNMVKEGERKLNAVNMELQQIKSHANDIKHVGNIGKQRQEVTTMEIEVCIALCVYSLFP